MNIFVGNLSFEATETDIRREFLAFGSVSSVSIVKEKNGVKSRGFGFIEMPDNQQAQDAITALNAREFMGRPLEVSVARSKPKASRDNTIRKKTGYKKGRRSHSFMKKRAAAGRSAGALPSGDSGANDI